MGVELTDNFRVSKIRKIMKFKKYNITSFNADTLFCSIALILGVLILAYARNDEIDENNSTRSQPFIARVFLDITIFGLKLLTATACVILPIVAYDKWKSKKSV